VKHWWGSICEYVPNQIWVFTELCQAILLISYNFQKDLNLFFKWINSDLKIEMEFVMNMLYNIFQKIWRRE